MVGACNTMRRSFFLGAPSAKYGEGAMLLKHAETLILSTSWAPLTSLIFF